MCTDSSEASAEPAVPETRTPGPDTPFEIGLVMAGAISAGAYTAGVMDFLIEALDEWEKTKSFARAHPDNPAARECPMHEVRLKVMAGSSAGGMTAGLAAGLLGMRFESVTQQPLPDRPAHPTNNNLYRSWVNMIDIDPLLGRRDLQEDGGAPVRSVLDSSILSDIARDAFCFERPDEKIHRSYVADPLHVLLTVTNLRGVPYAIPFDNWVKKQQYEMTMHADHMHFIVSSNPFSPDEEAFCLKSNDFGDPETWGVLQTAALATGAFPLGLAPRLLKRPPSQYTHRQWALPGPYEINGVHYCTYWKDIPPTWPEIEEAVRKADSKTPFAYEFLCVDGGVMNNEPLDLARRILAGPQGSNPREGDKATRAIIMVLPFPNADLFRATYESPGNLFRLLFTTFNSLITQARFKPEELALAGDLNVFSRFLVVPRRWIEGKETPEPYAIACGSLGGFGGFLCRRFREHDYQLGRRNCQWFLQQYFVLPSKDENDERRNKLFDDWTAEARVAHRVVRGGRKTDHPLEPEDVLPRLPIIPLLGTARPDVPPPIWPKMTVDEIHDLRPKIQYRLHHVGCALIDQNVRGWGWGPPTRAFLKTFLWLKERSLVDSVMDAICEDLTTRDLMVQ